MQGYVSFGGAGYIYPAKASAKRGYAEGDRIKCQLDWEKQHVEFFVNAQQVGIGDWDGSDVAFPAISVFPGDLQADISFTV